MFKFVSKLVLIRPKSRWNFPSVFSASRKAHAISDDDMVEKLERFRATPPAAVRRHLSHFSFDRLW